MTEVKPLGLGLIGAGGFARFVLSAVADLPDVRLVAVTDTDSSRARRLASGYAAEVTKDAAAMLERDEVEVVLIATPPHTHAEFTFRALAAGRHVFCEKPVALTEADADRVRAAVIASGRAYVVDHVLRYNAILAGIRRLHEEGLLPCVQRLAFENDAADEDLPPGHWFWNDAIRGGILLEHGVHFFDAAAMLLATAPCRVQAISGRRPDGRTDSVVCTVEHCDGALASYAHGFSHPHRAERQLMHLDFGLAEARVHGWLPLRADLDIWADDDIADNYRQLPGRAAELLATPESKPTGWEQISVTVERDAAPTATHARGIAYRAPHHVTACLHISGPNAKDRVYRDSVRSAMGDLILSARTGSTPRADITAGHAAVRLAAAATAALHDATTHRLAHSEAS